MNTVEDWDKVIAIWKDLLNKGCEVDMLLGDLGQEKLGQELYEYCVQFTVRLALLRAQVALKAEQSA